MEILKAGEMAVRVCVLITGLAGFYAGRGEYRKPNSPHRTVYYNTKDTATASFARMYDTWLLTSTETLVAYFFYETRQSSSTVIFWLELSTYLIALFHFVTEIFVFRATSLIPGAFMPLVVAGFYIIWIYLMYITSYLT